MDCQFFFGPDKRPFRLSKNGLIESEGSVFFHGIISRGLLDVFIANKLRLELWHQHAHDLPSLKTDSGDPELEQLKVHFLTSGVLTFGQSSYCAERYVAHFLAEENLRDAQVELWNIKEGHTSSVWKVSLSCRGKDIVFIVNVARDQAAGLELKETSERLKIIGDQFSDINLARVYDIFTLHDTSLPCEVVITRNEWIDDSYEIHSRINKETGDEQLMIVERFLTDIDNPAQITSVYGRLFNQPEVKEIRDQVDNFLGKASSCLPSKPQLNLREGDVVWNGKFAVVVAIT